VVAAGYYGKLLKLVGSPFILRFGDKLLINFSISLFFSIFKLSLSLYPLYLYSGDVSGAIVS
jgi:hypothetical protein